MAELLSRRQFINSNKSNPIVHVLNFRTIVQRLLNHARLKYKNITDMNKVKHFLKDIY